MKTTKRTYSRIIGLLTFVPYFRRILYSRMINDICDEKECEKVINFYNTIPLEERIKLFKENFNFTKSD